MTGVARPAGPRRHGLQVGDAGTTGEDADPALRCWEFHDLLFHARSREGRHDAPVGAIYPLAGRARAAAGPASRPPAPRRSTCTAPIWNNCNGQDPPFARVQEQRRSLRQYAAEPITDRQLGEFLYRVARVRERQEMEVDDAAGPVRDGVRARGRIRRGGGLYELEVYAVVNACHSLSAGLYHYDPLSHRLGRLADRTAEVERLLSAARRWRRLLAPAQPQVLLILAARLPRIAWKYFGWPTP